MTTAIVYEKIDLEKVVSMAQIDDTKHVIVAVGRSARFSGKTGVTGVFYETYEDLAPEMLNNIERDTSERFRINKAMIIHRFGKIPLGELTYVVAVSASRHEDAFQACKFIVDGINSDLPVWKYEVPVSSE